MIPVCHPVPHGLRSLSLRVTQNGLRKPLPRKHIYLYLPPKTPHPPARAAEYLIRYLVVHPHVKERLIPPALLFYLFRYDFLIPKDFRLLHPRNAAPQHRRRVQERPLRVIEHGVEDFLRHRVHLPVLHQRRAADSLDA